jgi:hypothetical protein
MGYLKCATLLWQMIRILANEILSGHIISTCLFQTSVKRQKRPAKKVRKKASKYQVAFTTSDVYTYYLKGWTQDLIDLGGSPSTLETVKLLWCQYLKKVTHITPGASPTITSYIVQTFTNLQEHSRLLQCQRSST